MPFLPPSPPSTPTPHRCPTCTYPAPISTLSAPSWQCAQCGDINRAPSSRSTTSSFHSARSSASVRSSTSSTAPTSGSTRSTPFFPKREDTHTPQVHRDLSARESPAARIESWLEASQPRGHAREKYEPDAEEWRENGCAVWGEAWRGVRVWVGKRAKQGGRVVGVMA